ncbi:MAG TPA: four helix bundle protein [Pyrinomonadaceae bacterium]|nr:four helix bundle protein [Pyrinomonadaceae bacterium]
MAESTPVCFGCLHVSKGFPREEVYGLTSQFRRAAISVAANIAENFKKRGRLDKVRFMNIAEGSLEE